MDDDGPRKWRILLPYRNPPLTANMRFSHWSQERRLQQKLSRDVRLLARSMKIPRLRAVTAELVFLPGTNRRRDADNIAPTLKPALDGLVAARVLRDDSADVVLRASQRVVLLRDDPTGKKHARLYLMITDMSALGVD
jgi:hypothetical protein